MAETLVTVAIPTLLADSMLAECIDSLNRQSLRDFEVIVIDNSGQGLARRNGSALGAHVIENRFNAGFGAAVNQAFRRSGSQYFATLNDDALAHREWLESLVRRMEEWSEAGMCASAVRLYGQGRLDSAGMLLAVDGSSKQRGHGETYESFAMSEEVLLPSASAALYRRAMLEEIGGFDERFFLYCEDTDLGLRAHWAGWKCIYVPEAVVDHHYSHSAGRASGLKAYYVERNRLFLVVKNFPAGMMAVALFAAMARYVWHAWYLFTQRGSAARFRAEGNQGVKLIWYVVRAHLAVLRHSRHLWHQRREIQAHARITPVAFRQLFRAHSIALRKVADL